MPSDPTVIPTQYALRKLKAGDYCELHYFTNKGLEEAKVHHLVAEPDALVMLPAADGLHSWVPTAVVRDQKAAPVVRDEHLSWEDFNEAAPRMITCTTGPKTESICTYSSGLRCKCTAGVMPQTL